MLGELIGEFTGKNTVYRVLPDGKIETSNQETGKLLGWMRSSFQPPFLLWEMELLG